MTDNKYSKGKIYVIKCKNDDTLVYVGSTTQTLGDRASKHRYDCNLERCKHWLVYRTIDNKWDDWDISLHSLYPCNNKTELCRREGEVIREIGTLNKRIAGRTMKEWYDEHKDDLAVKMKEYYLSKHEQILKQKKDYYIRNKDVIKEKQRKKYVSRKRG